MVTGRDCVRMSCVCVLDVDGCGWWVDVDGGWMWMVVGAIACRRRW